jgi:mannosylglycerate hydrolase
MAEPRLLVSHFHWDREWYRDFQEFRGRLVDAIDSVLDLVAADPGFRFMLDGQAIVLEDYLVVRPQRRAELEAGLASGRLAAGPWYVQPDSFLPGGETHVRNLLHGRAVASEFGPVSSVAYVPDSFGHPAQFPQLFAGFGLDPFVYWRGNGSEIDELGPFYAWRAPDGSTVRAWHLVEGYFGAAGLDADNDIDATAARLEDVIKRIEAAGTGPVLLMNGFDHLPPDTSTAPIADAVGAQRVLLDDARDYLAPIETLPTFTGELNGGRIANLLPGVWSSRMQLKLRNRACETLLTAWAEPWAAFGRMLGLPDETPALTQAWRTLLCNQAHDSIGGCSVDPVHERMLARYDDAEGLARATVQRTLEHLAGRSLTRGNDWSDSQSIVVFNASPLAKSGIVRVPLAGFPPWRVSVTRFDMHPLELSTFTGMTVDGEPARLVPSDDPNRVQFVPGVGAWDVEFIARGVPSFGWQRYELAPGDPCPDEIDDGRELDGLRVEDDGTFAFGRYAGLFGIEDAIDRGDSYDADCDEPRSLDVTVTVERIRHPSGIGRLRVTREIADIGTLVVTASAVPDHHRTWRFDVSFDNRATDHRLRLRFPTGAPVSEFRAATTFDAATRTTEPVDDSGWLSPAPGTFPHQGWIEANKLLVGAPGLPEAEVTPDGDILVTLMRSVGMLSRLELRTRPMPAGPEMHAPGAQELGVTHALFTLSDSNVARRDAIATEVGLWGVIGGDHRDVEPNRQLLEIAPMHCQLSACKPAATGDGLIVRLTNPSDEPDTVTAHFGFPVEAYSVRLDETRTDEPLAVQDNTVTLQFPPHTTRSFYVRPAPRS